MKYFFDEVKRLLAIEVARILEVEESQVSVEYPNETVGADLAVPVFRFASVKSAAPAKLAEIVSAGINIEAAEKVEHSGGFVNVWLKPSAVANKLLASDIESYGNHDYLNGEQILVEHTDPNPFKELHIGHLYSNTVGESLARLHEAAGAQVVRLSYHGDIGLHIAKAVWAIGESINWDENRISEIESVEDIGKFYATGNTAYDTDAKSDIEAVNRKIYSAEDKMINRLYEIGKAKSFAYFESVYKKLDVGFDAKIMESQSAPIGIDLVKANTPNIFHENNGAIIYQGEQDGLHTRVFVSSQGLPTYESKDLGLMELKAQQYPKASKSIIVTANEVDAYFRVVLAAMRKIKPALAEKTVHLSHGVVKLPDGKMSSRSGNIKTAESLISDVKEAVEAYSDNPLAVSENVLAAIKYSFLKPAIGGDIIYDVNQSISLEGQTGPYVQYAAVRVQSILDIVNGVGDDWGEYTWQTEKQLLIHLSRYPEVTYEATRELAPHLVAQYVYDLARELNRYYEKVNVKDAPEEERAARVAMLRMCLQVLKHGLSLLNIPTPTRM